MAVRRRVQISVLVLAGVAGSAALAGAAGPRFVILSGLSDESNALLRTALLQRADLDLELRSVRAEDVTEVASAGSADESRGFVGYPLPVLERLSRDRPLAPSPEPDTGRPAFRPVERTFEGLWLDPLGVAFHLGATGGDLPEERVRGELPASWSGLADGRFEDQLLLEAPRIDNATGALLTRLAGEGGGVMSADRTLERLDANVHGGYAVDVESLLSRLTGGALLYAVTTRRAAFFYQRRDARVRFQPIGSERLGLVLGAAVEARSPSLADAFWSVLGDPVVVARLAVLEQVVPVGAAVPDADLAEWARPMRAALTEADRQLAEESARVSGVVRYFQDEIQGVFRRRQERFSEYYDALGILLVVVFVVWMLKRSAPRERA